MDSLFNCNYNYYYNYSTSLLELQELQRKQNKRLVTNEIQLSLDNAIEEYYAKIAKNKFTTIIGLQPESGDSFLTDNINLEMFSKDTNLAKMKDSVKSHEIKPSFQRA